MKVALPWSLPHYFPLNSFDDKYAALIINETENITFYCWDHYKVSRFLHGFPTKRLSKFPGNVVLKPNYKKLHKEWQALTENVFNDRFVFLTACLPGDIEFVHSAPFASLTRPFVFQCERFASIFHPLTQDRLADKKTLERARNIYREILASELCLTIHSHIPDTLSHIRDFFDDEVINAKLHLSSIAFPKSTISGRSICLKSMKAPRFIFINPKNDTQNTHDIITVLNFWKNYKSLDNPGILLICNLEIGDDFLNQEGVERDFIQEELGHSIQCYSKYLREAERDALIESCNFAILPRPILDTALLITSQAKGTIPIVFDAQGVKHLVRNDFNALVLDASSEKEIIDRIVLLIENPKTMALTAENGKETYAVNFQNPDVLHSYWRNISQVFEICQDAGLSSADICKDYSSEDLFIEPSNFSKQFSGPRKPVKFLESNYASFYKIGQFFYRIPRKEDMNFFKIWNIFKEGSDIEVHYDLVLKNKDFLLYQASPKYYYKAWAVSISNRLKPYKKIHSLAKRIYTVSSHTKKSIIKFFIVFNSKLSMARISK